MSKESVSASGCLGVLIGVVVLIVLVALIFTIPVYFLWNWLMPAIFGIKTITFWQALGLNLLCGFLFKSSGSSCNSNS